jgi:hypothetical protein
MIRKHIDVLALGALLLALGVITQVRRSATLEQQSLRLVNFTTQHLQELTFEQYTPNLCLSRD